MSAYYKRLLFAAAVTLGLTGCASKHADMLHFLREYEHEVSAIEYRVGIPDVISISAPRILEIDSEAQQIQADGKINLRLLGEVKVVGMTAKEIAAKFEVLLSRYYVDPKVRVSVAAYKSKKIYVYNQAGLLAALPYTGRDTLLDAVVNSRADFRSWTSQVKVIRPSHDEEPVRTIVVDVDKMTKTGDWSQNILLEPDDIVVIPPTPGSWLAQRVREILYPVGPAVQLYTAPATFLYMDDVYDEENGNRPGWVGGSIGGSYLYP